jgi:hypothetical protein
MDTITEKCPVEEIRRVHCSGGGELHKIAVAFAFFEE